MASAQSNILSPFGFGWDNNVSMINIMRPNIQKQTRDARKKPSDAAFTLIELLIVIAIIAIQAALPEPSAD